MRDAESTMDIKDKKIKQLEDREAELLNRLKITMKAEQEAFENLETSLKKGNWNKKALLYWLLPHLVQEIVHKFVFFLFFQVIFREILPCLMRDVETVFLTSCNMHVIEFDHPCAVLPSP
jgi:hypothetical protein